MFGVEPGDSDGDGRQDRLAAAAGLTALKRRIGAPQRAVERRLVARCRAEVVCRLAEGGAEAELVPPAADLVGRAIEQASLDANDPAQAPGAGHDALDQLLLDLVARVERSTQLLV